MSFFGGQADIAELIRRKRAEKELLEAKPLPSSNLPHVRVALPRTLSLQAANSYSHDCWGVHGHTGLLSRPP